jgi:hypothetical protein
MQLSELVKENILGSIYEIYNNAFQHSSSNIGVFSCGQFYPKNKSFQLSIVDYGIGVVDSVRKYFAFPASSEYALRWAFTSGNSTREINYPRGIGLSILIDFIRINHGRMELVANNGLASITDNGLQFTDLSDCFDGTFVNIELKSDNNFYCMKSELPIWNK